MAHTRQQVYRRTHDVTDDGDVVETEEVTHNSSDQTARQLQNLVMAIVGFISGLLIVRFLLSLFGANPANPFADLIYDLTTPLISPFRGLFRIDTTLDETGSHLEIETLTAIVVYYLVGLLIIRLINAGRSNAPEV